MLSGFECKGYFRLDFRKLGWPKVTDQMLQTAMGNLYSRFIFVGLTDQWDLSVCLFHTMFGGRCHGREFVNTRPDATSSNTSQIHRSDDVDDVLRRLWTDRFDGELFSAASSIFWARIEKHGLNQS